jgi:hypothetical protein
VNAATGKEVPVAPEALDQVTVPDLRVAGDQVLTVTQEEGKIPMAPKVCMVRKVAGQGSMEAQDRHMVLEWVNTVELHQDMDQVVTADVTTDRQDMVLPAMADWVQQAGADLPDLQAAGVLVVNLEEGNTVDMARVVWAPVQAMAEWGMKTEASGIGLRMKCHHGSVMKKQNAVGNATGG